jgi:hypothetical protein
MLLQMAGIGGERLRVQWVSASEGQLFARYVTEYSQAIQDRGPFYPQSFEAELEALQTALSSRRLRWLTGMELQVTERANAYGERLDKGSFHELLHRSAEEEYQKGLVLYALNLGPRSVREIALETGLGVHTVSRRLTDLEKARQARFLAYEGTTPRFVAAPTPERVVMEATPGMENPLH